MLSAIGSRFARAKIGRWRYSAAMHRREAILTASAWPLALAADLEPLRVALANAEVPCFLGVDYVCTELPTHITGTRSREQQDLVDQAYEGWVKDA